MLYSTPTDISSRTTHDLWVEARQFETDISRPTPTSIKITVRYPKTLAVVDGVIIVMSTKPVDVTQSPKDGEQYAASTDFAAPADTIAGAQVVAFYSNILSLPIPAEETSPASAYVWFEVTVENTVANQLYYASVHPSSNVLQYYPLGIQTYPMSTATGAESGSSYTGNIPSLPFAPTSPTTGMVYHDQQLNIIQYWTGSQWIPSRSDTIISGAFNPGILGQVYFQTGGGNLQIFNGVKWREVKPSNFSVRVGNGWVPIANQSGVPIAPSSPLVGDFYYDYTTQRAQYWDGTTWIFPSSSNTLFNEGSLTAPGFVVPMVVEPMQLPNPYIGQLFYNTTIQKLMVWSGTTWIQANTDQEGTTISEKVAIGDDGSYDQRMELIKILQNQLGWPQYCVELKEEQFNIAIGNALDNYRQWCDGAYTMEYIMFNLLPGQQKYYLNSPLDKTDRIVDVSKIHRLSYGGMLPSNGPQDVWSQAFAQSFYNTTGGGGDLLSTHLVASYSEELTRLFAGNYTFVWNEPRRELLLTRRVVAEEKIIIEAHLERTSQEILVDRWSRQFIQNWALAEAKMMLGMSRSKFSSGTPGAQGTINLNGELLISEARQDMTELKQSILDYEYGGHVNLGNVSFMIG